MLRILFSIFIFISLLHAQEEDKGKKIEVTAKNISSTKTTVTGSDGVVVYYGDSVIKADKAIYNKETQLLVLDGKVEMIGYMGSKEHSNHLEIQTDKDIVTFKDLFMVSKNDVWLYTNKAINVDGNYTFGKSVLSSCEANDPLWKMAFERSKYDSEDEYMKIYDAKIYFKDVPIVYTPYMAFSTNNDRASGLLFPLFGFSSSEGFIYDQPIFWAIADNMDLEFNPQIRTNRSVGMYATYRFVDTPQSSGMFRVGYFKDKPSYVEDNNLIEDTHYGVEFNYDSSKVFSDYMPNGFTDGLYINTIFLNDIDYLNLQKSRLNHYSLTNFQESKLNYFAYDDDYYAGLYAKYFIDTSKTDNSDTIQILPQVHLHKYLSSIFVDNLTYSANLQVSNYTRQKGATMQQVDLKIPIEFTTSFFDDFVSLSIGEDILYNKSYFGNSTFPHDQFQYYSNTHKAKIFSDLTKKYDTFVHVLQPSLSYLKPGYVSQKPVDFDDLEIEQQNLFTVYKPEENYLLSMGQYFYNEKSALVFYQRISQSYYNQRVNKLVDLSNEMQYKWRTWTFYNNIVYSNQYKELRESSSRIYFSQSSYRFGVGHTYKETLPDDLTSVAPSNDLNFNFGYTYSDHIGFNGNIIYNLDSAYSEQWTLGGYYKQDCWSMTASLRRENTPRPNNQFELQDTFYVQFNFIPFITVGSN
ncbi:Outer membrane protein Imp, required for envelope biogenesis / Organic solvent tolerance protein precursor [hydrothermal vent metagenome]|uniref:Outer membrane protein Imp, required for envelope biogenesis / Organic solvent tolerance protein n=1 Tax=hydrothermal vent metagenome TaxID=652676 RepID=A0A1W1EC52_9ZZZZ